MDESKIVCEVVEEVVVDVVYVFKCFDEVYVVYVEFDVDFDVLVKE